MEDNYYRLLRNILAVRILLLIVSAITKSGLKYRFGFSKMLAFKFTYAIHLISSGLHSKGGLSPPKPYFVPGRVIKTSISRRVAQRAQVVPEHERVRYSWRINGSKMARSDSLCLSSQGGEEKRERPRAQLIKHLPVWCRLLQFCRAMYSGCVYIEWQA